LNVEHFEAALLLVLALYQPLSKSEAVVFFNRDSKRGGFCLGGQGRGGAIQMIEQAMVKPIARMRIIVAKSAFDEVDIVRLHQ
jgi:hypothetical protein